ncbi:protein Mis18-beta [Pimephales promelas]|uniref:protein Mis18-beta n=1 Tax=Pimephales promelas TaxID=90988 RepID=UPI0019557345|nr:protein Mis18-beta [Pimephales promelas]KAG1950309.1 protein Mis18-beta [Pimephales promelas]KAG1950310.1 protein Mis18-beta [Pimephales promelas]
MSNSTRSLLESSYDIGPCDSTQTSSIAEQLRELTDKEMRMVDYRNCSVLQCLTCNTVLGDSLGMCGEVQSLESIICLNVTEDVRVNKKLEMSLIGKLAFSTYQVLHCAGCNGSVGLVLHSTPEHLSALRNLFLLRKELINCYMLRSGTCVNASKINFKHRLVDKNIKELKQYLEAQLKQVNILEDMMEKLSTHTT